MMNSNLNNLTGKTALVTGSAKRVGAETVRTLHSAGMNVIIHCHSSKKSADELSETLNSIRENSSHVLQTDLSDTTQLEPLIMNAAEVWGRLDVLINNASSFYPTPIGTITLEHWDNLFSSNLKAPLFLSQAAAPYLKDTQGCIVNMADIHAYKPMREHTVYCVAKAGLVMLTQSLARELGPEIRVNSIAPGVILWPEAKMEEETKNKILERTALKRSGEPQDIANTILFLVRDAKYITGQIIPVDGGRSLNM